MQDLLQQADILKLLLMFRSSSGGEPVVNRLHMVYFSGSDVRITATQSLILHSVLNFPLTRWSVRIRVKVSFLTHPHSWIKWRRPNRWDRTAVTGCIHLVDHQQEGLHEQS